MRELIYYVAATLDGFIAEADGSFDTFPWDAEYGADLAATFPETMPTHMRQGAEIEPKLFDIVLMGRNTMRSASKKVSRTRTLRCASTSSRARWSPAPTPTSR